MTNDNTLKPCPFCGRKPENNGFIYITPHKRSCCFDEHTTIDPITQPKYIKKWNTRHESRPIQSEHSTGDQLNGDKKHWTEHIKSEPAGEGEDRKLSDVFKDFSKLPTKEKINAPELRKLLNSLPIVYMMAGYSQQPVETIVQAVCQKFAPDSRGLRRLDKSNRNKLAEGIQKIFSVDGGNFYNIADWILETFASPKELSVEEIADVLKYNFVGREPFLTEPQVYEIAQIIFDAQRKGK